MQDPLNLFFWGWAHPKILPPSHTAALMSHPRPSKNADSGRNSGISNQQLQRHTHAEPIGAQEYECFSDIEESDSLHHNEGVELLPNDTQEEIAHYEAVIGALAFYERASDLQFKRMVRQLSIIPVHHRQLFGPSNNETKDYLSPIERYARLKEASEANARFINAVLSTPDDFLGNVSSATPEEIIRRPTQPSNPPKNPLSGFNAEKVHSTLCQLAREWSSDGLPERIATFDPIFTALETYLPVSNDTRYQCTGLI